MNIVVNDQDIKDLLAGAPKTTDQLNAVCRTLEITIKKVDGLVNYVGQSIELYYGSARWFKGYIFKRGFKENGDITYTAYDPLYYLKRYSDDWYFKNMTTTQAVQWIATKVGLKVYSIANTDRVLPALYYQAGEGDKVLVDILARTYFSTGFKYWYRYRSDLGSEGLHVFKKEIPTEVWIFTVGVNLTAASKEESIEETCTVVKLINRETGQAVTKVDTEAFKNYGQLVHFEEVDKEFKDAMNWKAQDLLDKLKRVKVTMSAEGINPDGVIPQLYSGDVIYIEEPTTGIIGSYYIRNVTQTFVNDNLIQLSFDVTVAEDLPDLEYKDATDTSKITDTTAATINYGYGSEVANLLQQYGSK